MIVILLTVIHNIYLSTIQINLVTSSYCFRVVKFVNVIYNMLIQR